MILHLELLISLLSWTIFIWAGFFILPVSSLSLTLSFTVNSPDSRIVSHTIYNFSFFNTNLFPSVQKMSTFVFLWNMQARMYLLVFLSTTYHIPYLPQWLFMTALELEKICCNPHKLPDLISHALCHTMSKSLGSPVYQFNSIRKMLSFEFWMMNCVL